MEEGHGGTEGPKNQEPRVETCLSTVTSGSGSLGHYDSGRNPPHRVPVGVTWEPPLLVSVLGTVGLTAYDVSVEKYGLFERESIDMKHPEETNR